MREESREQKEESRQKAGESRHRCHDHSDITGTACTPHAICVAFGFPSCFLQDAFQVAAPVPQTRRPHF